MTFSIVNWATGFALSKSISGLAGKMQQLRGLESELRQAVVNWVKDLPPSIRGDSESGGALEPRALFQECPSPGVAQVELQRLLESKTLPRPEDWFAALLEQWFYIRKNSTDGVILCKFFRISEETVTPHFERLAAQFDGIVARKEDFFRPGALAVLRTIDRRLDKIEGGAETTTECAFDDTPRKTAKLFGRSPEIETICGTSERHTFDEQLVFFIVGTSGVGKSALAEHCADFLRRRMGVQYHRISLTERDSRSEREILELLDVRSRAGVVAKRLFHIENANDEITSRLANALIDKLGSSIFLVTGQFQAFGIGRNWVRIKLQPLENTEAFELLKSSGTAAPDEEIQLLAKHLGNLPLALCLAAGYLRFAYSPKEFLSELDESALTLSPVDISSTSLGGDETAKTLHSTIAVAWRTFERSLGKGVDASLMFELASLPQDGFGRSLGEAAIACGGNAFIQLISRALLVSLVEKHPVRQNAWRFHPLVRNFLCRKCANKTAVQARVDQWIIDRIPTNRKNQLVQGHNWSEVCDEWALFAQWLRDLPPTKFVDVVRIGAWFAQCNGPWKTWLSACERALIGINDLSPSALYSIHWLIAEVSRRLDLPERMLSAGFAMLAIAQACESVLQEGFAWGIIASYEDKKGNLSEALEIRKNEELPKLTEANDRVEVRGTFAKIVNLVERLGDPEQALFLYTSKLLPAYRREGDLREVANCLLKMAEIKIGYQKDRISGLKMLLEAREIYEQVCDRRERALVNAMIARLKFDDGDRVSARELLVEVLSESNRLESEMFITLVLPGILEIDSLDGNHDEVLRVIDICSQKSQTVKNDRWIFTQKIAALCASERFDEAVQAVEDENLDSSEAALPRIYIAQAVANVGRLDDALQIVRQVISGLEPTDERVLCVSELMMSVLLYRSKCPESREKAMSLYRSASRNAEVLGMVEQDSGCLKISFRS